MKGITIQEIERKVGKLKLLGQYEKLMGLLACGGDWKSRPILKIKIEESAA